MIAWTRQLAVLSLSLPLACSAAPAADSPTAELDRGLPESKLVTPRPDPSGPRLLAVVAHPDDEIAFGGTMYKTSTFLDGVADVAIVTNGEGGYKYATLAEGLYGVRLTDEAVGRANLPAIRRREVEIGGLYLHLRRIFFLDQPDHRYTQDIEELLGEGADVWDIGAVRRDLDAILRAGRYDFVLTHGPVADTHAHHKAATILALQAVQALPEDDRPIVLGVRWSRDDGPPPTTEVIPGWPVTEVLPAPPVSFERNQTFGYKDRLTYQIVVNWAITAHKSQGTMQLLTNVSDRETYFLYALNPPDAVLRTAALFEALARPQFETPVYDDALSED